MVLLSPAPFEIGQNFKNKMHNVDYMLEIIRFYDGGPQNPLIPLIILNWASDVIVLCALRSNK